MSEKVNTHVKKAEREASPWMLMIARFGFFAKGLVYLLVGMLVLQAALGSGSPNVKAADALRSVIQQPFGVVLLWIIVIGLIAYALWKWFQALLDPDVPGLDSKRILPRAFDFVTGAVYAALAFAGWGILHGSSNSGSTGGGLFSSGWTARFMSTTWGLIVVGLIGLIIAIVGLYQFYDAYKQRFMRHVNTFGMSSEQREWIRYSGEIGYAARGVIFPIIGWFLINAAVNHNAQQGIKNAGLGVAFGTLAKQPFGPWLIGIVAIGFMAYGIFEMSLGWYYKP